MLSSIVLPIGYCIVAAIAVYWLIIKPSALFTYSRNESSGSVRRIPADSRLWHRHWRGVALKLEKEEGDVLTVTVVDTYGVSPGEPPVGAELKVPRSDVYYS